MKVKLIQNTTDMELDTDNEYETSNLLINNITYKPYVHYSKTNVENKDQLQKNNVYTYKPNIFTTETAKILDSYEFGRFHLLIILALGTTWILDGYEVSLVSSLSKYLSELGITSNEEFGYLGFFYLAGAVSGSLIFGYLASYYGRKRLFQVTLIIYIVSILTITFSYSKIQFYIARFFTGVAIGGEYSAIFSSIDELLPAYIRGRADLIIDGTWHIGSALSAVISFLVINNSKAEEGLLIRMLFGAGSILAIVVIILRMFIPESPRWLINKGRVVEAMRILKKIDGQCECRESDVNEKEKSSTRKTGNYSEHIDKMINNINIDNDNEKLTTDIHIGDSSKISDLSIQNTYQQKKINSHSLYYIFKYMIFKKKSRFFYAFILISTQAFFYLGTFYSFTNILTDIFHINKSYSMLYLIPLSFASFLGPILFGHLFDTYSRRKMIVITNLITFLFTSIIAFSFIFNFLPFYLFETILFFTFLFASPAASSAHLTISEIFPIEIRCQALGFFFSCGYGITSVAPYLFSVLAENGNHVYIGILYLISGFSMGLAGVVSYYIGVDCENKSLEEINQEFYS